MVPEHDIGGLQVAMQYSTRIVSQDFGCLLGGRQLASWLPLGSNFKQLLFLIFDGLDQKFGQTPVAGIGLAGIGKALLHRFCQVF